MWLYTLIYGSISLCMGPYAYMWVYILMCGSIPLSYLRTYPMTSGGRRGAITDLLTTSRHPFRSFDTLRDSAARRQVQSLILSSHRFLCGSITLCVGLYAYMWVYILMYGYIRLYVGLYPYVWVYTLIIPSYLSHDLGWS